MSRMIVAAMAVVLGVMAQAATLTVDLNGGADYTDIQSAIDAAADGDTVLVKPGEYVITEPITFGGKAIAVRGEAGAAETVMRMAEEPADPDRASVVIFESGETQASVLEGFTLTGGEGTRDPSEQGMGGGVYCDQSSPTLTHCTISGNSAGSGGGGVYCVENSSPTLTHCTISGNSAYWGGGVYCGANSSPTLTNCIVWGNTPESVCGEMSHCLTDQDPLFVRPGEWVDCGSPDDPLCIAYQWNETGDPTAWRRWVFDYRLQPGSPAIDAGTSEGAPRTDIEGNSRPCGAGVDIGAYEFGDCGVSAPFRRGDANADGRVDIADAVFTLSYLFADGTVPLCLDATDANDDGKVDIADAIKILAHLFAGAGPLPAPFDECGIDPTIDALGCASYTPCN